MRHLQRMVRKLKCVILETQIARKMPVLLSGVRVTLPITMQTLAPLTPESYTCIYAKYDSTQLPSKATREAAPIRRHGGRRPGGSLGTFTQANFQHCAFYVSGRLNQRRD